MITTSTIPLRQRKIAKSKLALLNALIKYIRNTPFEEIPVKQLCEEAEIAPATFFNYFDKKSDLFIYAIQLWTMEALSELHTKFKDYTALEAIEALFLFMAQKYKEHPQLMQESLAFLAHSDGAWDQQLIDEADKVVYLSHKLQDNVLHYKGLQDVFKDLLRAALKQKELPEKTDITMASLTLVTIFFGVPLASKMNAIFDLSFVYNAMLATFWQGLTAKAS